MARTWRGRRLGAHRRLGRGDPLRAEINVKRAGQSCRFAPR